MGSALRWALLVYSREPYCNTTERQADMTPDPCPTFRCLWHAAAERQVAISGIQVHNKPLMGSEGMVDFYKAVVLHVQNPSHQQTNTPMHFLIRLSLFVQALR